MTEQLTKNDVYTPDDFITGAGEVETTEITIASGQTLVARQAVAIDSTNSKGKAFSSGGANGLGSAKFITAYAVDATGGDTKVQVYKAGSFNPEKVTATGLASNDEKAAAFAGTPISLQTPQV